MGGGQGSGVTVRCGRARQLPCPSCPARLLLGRDTPFPPLPLLPAPAPRPRRSPAAPARAAASWAAGWPGGRCRRRGTGCAAGRPGGREGGGGGRRVRGGGARAPQASRRPSPARPHPPTQPVALSRAPSQPLPPRWCGGAAEPAVQCAAGGARVWLAGVRVARRRSCSGVRSVVCPTQRTLPAVPSGSVASAAQSPGFMRCRLSTPGSSASSCCRPDRTAGSARPRRRPASTTSATSLTRLRVAGVGVARNMTRGDRTCL
jgi:hypothetical protein